MRLSPATLKALKLLLVYGETTAGRFAIDMGYGKTRTFRMKGPTGAAVLKRLQARGLVIVWDEWYGGTYVTMAKLSEEGRIAATQEQENQ